MKYYFTQDRILIQIEIINIINRNLFFKTVNGIEIYFHKYLYYSYCFIILSNLNVLILIKLHAYKIN